MPSHVEKLLKKLRQTKKGWKADDLRIMYQHYGFTIRAGAKHEIITHPDFPEIRETLPRGSGELLAAYASGALKSIEKVIAKQAEQDEQATGDNENG